MNYQERAIKILQNRKLVLWVLEAMSREASAWDSVAGFATIFLELKPLFEKALEGIFPSSEELGQLTKWFDYPLSGVILHLGGNTSPGLHLFLKNHPVYKEAAETDFIQGVRSFYAEITRLKIKWGKLENELAPLREQFFEELDEATRRGQKSGEVFVENPLLEEWIEESVDPFSSFKIDWIHRLCPRWYYCGYSSELEDVEWADSKFVVKIWGGKN